MRHRYTAGSPCKSSTNYSTVFNMQSILFSRIYLLTSRQNLMAHKKRFKYIKMIWKETATKGCVANHLFQSVKGKILMVRSFGLGIPGTRNVYIGMSVENNGNKNVNITSSRNSVPKRTHHKHCAITLPRKFRIFSVNGHTNSRWFIHILLRHFTIEYLI